MKIIPPSRIASCVYFNFLLQSCLIKRYCEKRFVSKYMATLGIDFGVTRLKTTKYDVKVNIFDLAGQPFFYEVRTPKEILTIEALQHC